MLRRRDVLAWLPNLSKQELLKWERAGVISVSQHSPRAHKWYFTEEIAEVAGLGSVGQKNYRDRNGKRYYD